MSGAVQLDLTSDEALVLFELLSRYEETKALEVVDTAEKVALQSLLCALEKRLDEPLQPDHRELVSQARERLK